MAISWDQSAFERWYKMPNAQGVITTYSRVGMRYWRGPQPEWNYGVTAPQDMPPNSQYDPLQYPFHPMNEFRWRVEHIASTFGITATSRVLVLGAGYGFLPETFIWWQMNQGQTQAAAQPRMAGVDNSAYIQGNMSGSVHSLMSGKVVNRSLLDGVSVTQMRNQLRQAAGGSEFFDFVVTESVIESYTSAEHTNFLEKCQSYLAAGRPARNIIHLVFDGWDATGYWQYNATTDQQEWVALPAAQQGSPAKTLDEWAAVAPAHSWISAIGNMDYRVGV